MAAEAIKSFICQSEIPGLSQKGQADFLVKVESPVVLLTSCFQKWTEFDKQELSRYKTTAGTPIALRSQGPHSDARTRYKNI